MKKNYLILVIAGLLVTTEILAQDEPDGQQTLFSNRITSSGGYGGPLFQYTFIKDQSAFMTGGFGGWFANKKFTIGGGGYRLASGINVAEADRLEPGANMQYKFSYGGLYLAYALNSDKTFHPEFSLMAGTGWVSQENQDGKSFGKSTIAVLAPGVQLDINVFRFMRVGIGANYRFSFGSDTPGMSDQDLNGPSGFLAFKFGFFGR